MDTTANGMPSGFEIRAGIRSRQLDGDSGVIPIRPSGRGMLQVSVDETAAAAR